MDLRLLKSIYVLSSHRKVVVALMSIDIFIIILLVSARFSSGAVVMAIQTDLQRYNPAWIRAELIQLWPPQVNKKG